MCAFLLLVSSCTVSQQDSLITMETTTSLFTNFIQFLKYYIIKLLIRKSRLIITP